METTKKNEKKYNQNNFITNNMWISNWHSKIFYGS